MRFNAKKIPMSFYRIYDSAELALNFFFKRYPIHNSAPLSCNPFFIIGSGRSGNTLLRAILTSHSKISIPPESYVIAAVARKYQTLNYLSWKDLVEVIIGEFEAKPQFLSWEINFAPLYGSLLNLKKNEKSLATIIDKIYCYYGEQKFGSLELWGDKTPLNTLNLSWLDRIFKKAKYIHIIRDGRDVVHSYLNMGRFSCIEDACWRWNKSIELATAFGKHKGHDRYMEIRYENFVIQAETEIKKICSYLNIDYEEEMFLYHQKIENLGDTKQAHHTNLKKPVNPDSIGKWKKNLSSSQKIDVQRLLKDNLIKLGYQ
jgi:hypothetical protein